MELNTLHILRQTYGAQKGQYHGECVFDSADSKVQLSITPECANRILELCADGLVDAAQKVAHQTRNDILASVALLENKVDAEAKIQSD